MEDTLSSSDPIDLDALDDYLMSELAPDDRMGHSDLYGSSTRTVRCDSWNNGAVRER